MLMLTEKRTDHPTEKIFNASLNRNARYKFNTPVTGLRFAIHMYSDGTIVTGKNTGVIQMANPTK